MYEPGTHWEFSHQPMVPRTPPEFLKMDSHPPHAPSCIVHVYWRLSSFCCLSFHYWDKHRNHPCPTAGPGVRPLCERIHKKWPWMTRGKHLAVWPVARESLTVVGIVALGIIGECHHTSSLAILVQIMWGGDVLFYLDVSLWEFISDITFNRTELEKEITTEVKWPQL